MDKKLVTADLPVGHSMLVKAESGRIYRVKRKLDTDKPENPRNSDENIGIMLCWHDRYELGDGQTSMSIHETLVSILRSHCSGRPHYGRPVFNAIENGDAPGVLFIDMDGERRLDVADTHDIHGNPVPKSQWTWEIDEDSAISWPSEPEDIPDWFLDMCCEAMPTETLMSILGSLPDFAILPLYLEDVPRLSVRQDAPAASDAAGISGFIYAEDDGTKPWDKEQAIRTLENETKAYDRYLSGNAQVCIIYAFQPENEDERPEDAPESSFDDILVAWGLQDDERFEETIISAIGPFDKYNPT